jgi:hypothetical protein
MFLEYAVRPFQTADSHGAIIIPSTSAGTRERATITWGAKATMPNANAGINFQVQCCKSTATEKNRKNDRVRITGSDGESYVDVDRAYQMELNTENKNNCDDPSSQWSGVTQAMNEDMASWVSDFASIDFSNSLEGTCAATWNFSRS